MGCNQSTAVHVAPKVKQAQPAFAIETYKEKLHQAYNRNTGYTVQEARLKDMARRRPVLKMPDRVVAPSDALTDTGFRDFQSMQTSPTHKSRSVDASLRWPSKEISGHMPIDDIGEPPDHETVSEYVMQFDNFMWDVYCNPRSFSTRVAKLRRRMDMDFEETVEMSGTWEIEPSKYPVASWCLPLDGILAQ